MPDAPAPAPVQAPAPAPAETPAAAPEVSTAPQGAAPAPAEAPAAEPNAELAELRAELARLRANQEAAVAAALAAHWKAGLAEHRIDPEAADLLRGLYDREMQGREGGPVQPGEWMGGFKHLSRFQVQEAPAPTPAPSAGMRGAETPPAKHAAAKPPATPPARAPAATPPAAAKPSAPPAASGATPFAAWMGAPAAPAAPAAGARTPARNTAEAMRLVRERVAAESS